MPLRELIATKIGEKLPEIKKTRPVPVLTIISTLGADVIEQLYLPYMNYFITRAAEDNEPELMHEILVRKSI